MTFIHFVCVSRAFSTTESLKVPKGDSVVLVHINICVGT